MALDAQAQESAFRSPPFTMRSRVWWHAPAWHAPVNSALGGNTEVSHGLMASQPSHLMTARCVTDHFLKKQIASTRGRCLTQHPPLAFIPRGAQTRYRPNPKKILVHPKIFELHFLPEKVPQYLGNPRKQNSLINSEFSPGNLQFTGVW